MATLFIIWLILYTLCFGEVSLACSFSHWFIKIESPTTTIVAESANTRPKLLVFELCSLCSQIAYNISFWGLVLILIRIETTILFVTFFQSLVWILTHLSYANTLSISLSFSFAFIRLRALLILFWICTLVDYAVHFHSSMRGVWTWFIWIGIFIIFLQGSYTFIIQRLLKL